MTEPHAADDIDVMLSRIEKLQQEAQNNDCHRLYYTSDDFLPSHVLLIPLIAIMEYSAIMKRQPFGPLDDKGRYLEFFDVIHSSAEYILSHIKECPQEDCDCNLHLFDEFRTPLSAIIGFSEVIKSEYFGPVGDHRYLEYAEKIFSSGCELHQDFCDMIDIARIKKSKRELNPEIVDVQQIVQEILRKIEQKPIKTMWKPEVGNQKFILILVYYK